MPEPIKNGLVSDLNPDVAFYALSSENSGETQSIRPCLTISELGIQLNDLGVLKPSSFGKKVDEWMSKDWIQIKNRTVIPGQQVLKQLGKAQSLKNKLLELNRLVEETTLRHETVIDIITS
jgi:hypothetical protein